MRVLYVPESGAGLCRAQSVGRRGARRRDAGDGAIRDALAPLAPLLRLEHLPQDHDLLHQVSPTPLLTILTLCSHAFSAIM